MRANGIGGVSGESAAASRAARQRIFRRRTIWPALTVPRATCRRLMPTATICATNCAFRVSTEEWLATRAPARMYGVYSVALILWVSAFRCEVSRRLFVELWRSFPIRVIQRVFAPIV
jgi:hypothetical protein